MQFKMLISLKTSGSFRGINLTFSRVKFKGRIKIAISFILYYTGIIYLLIKVKTHFPLTYHNVIPDRYFDGTVHLGVSHSESNFQRHIQILSRYVGIKKLEITFDDGYLNNLLIAIPILNEYKIKATFFVPLMKSEASKPFWIDRMMLLLSYCPFKNYIVGGIAINIEKESDRLSSFIKLFGIVCKNYSKKDQIMQDVDMYLNKFSSEITPDYYSLRFTFINNDGLENIVTEGHKLGFHSLDHEIYKYLTNKQIIGELDSVREKILSLKIDSFSFPFGGEDEINFEAIEILRSYGLDKIYSNVSRNLNHRLIQRRAIPNTANKYLVLAHYLNIF